MSGKKNFIMADRWSSRFHISNIQRKAVAFTMAEILLSLTIIGVVAAITLPSLTGNINERTWNTQRKALHTRMSQAIEVMGSLNGYGLVQDRDQTESIAAKTFIMNGLSKVYKINNICDAEHLGDCGIASKIKNFNNETISSFPKKLSELNSRITESNPNYFVPNTRVAAFETANGESIATFYNPYCFYSGGSWTYAQPYMCVNFIYDLNGKKGPNTIGKDIGFMSAVGGSVDGSVVAPHVKRISPGAIALNDVENYCNEDERLPDRNELVSIFYNIPLLSGENFVWGKKNVENPESRYLLYARGFFVSTAYAGNTGRVMCLER